MNLTLSKPILYGFVLTALVYLISLSFIDYPLNTILKPIPILILIIGVIRSDLIPWAKMSLVGALGFSMLGDMILTMPFIAFFLQAGIGCFFVTHIFYSFLMLLQFQFSKTFLIYYFLVLFMVIIMTLYLIPYLGNFLIPVLAYISILLLMVFSAFQVKDYRLMMSFGALNFIVSDFILAFNLFADQQSDMRIIIMLTYYLAQFLLINGLCGLYKRHQSNE